MQIDAKINASPREEKGPIMKPYAEMTAQELNEELESLKAQYRKM